MRSVNYHNTPAHRADHYRRGLEAYARHFTGVNEHELDAFLTTGEWSKSKPGLILAFYNGYRNNYDVMKPLLERFGFTGWFFVVPDFVNEPPRGQAAFAAQRHLRVVPGEYEDGRLALSWDEIRSLDAEHVIASHTKTHSHVSLESEEELRREICAPQGDFEAQLGHRVESFAWLFGSEFGENAAADARVLEAGYRYLFSNRKIQRVAATPRDAFDAGA